MISGYRNDKNASEYTEEVKSFVKLSELEQNRKAVYVKPMGRIMPAAIVCSWQFRMVRDFIGTRSMFYKK